MLKRTITVLVAMRIIILAAMILVYNYAFSAHGGFFL